MNEVSSQYISSSLIRPRGARKGDEAKPGDCISLVKVAIDSDQLLLLRKPPAVKLLVLLLPCTVVGFKHSVSL